MRKSVLIFFLLIVCLLIGLIVFQVSIYLSLKTSGKEGRVWDIRDKKEYANRLLAKGLNQEAAAAFEEFSRSPGLGENELSEINYRLGSIYMGLFNYEKALACFYKSELLNPNASFISEMNNKIVEALENLGMSSQAQYELESRTSLKPSDEKRGVPIAKIGNDTITESEINNTIDKLPEWIRNEYKDENKRYEFIQEYVGREVLYRKASRLGLDKSAEVREKLDLIKKELAVESLIEREIADKIKVEDEDVRLFFDANKDKYTDEESIKVSFVKFDDPLEKDKNIESLKQGETENKDLEVKKGSTYIPGVGEAANIIETLFTKEKGSITDAFKIDDSFYVFSIDDKKEKRQKTFSEVKRQIQYELMMKEQNKLMQNLMEKTMEEQQVDFYYTPKAEQDTVQTSDKEQQTDKSSDNTSGTK